MSKKRRRNLRDQLSDAQAMLVEMHRENAELITRMDWLNRHVADLDELVGLLRADVENVRKPCQGTDFWEDRAPVMVVSKRMFDGLQQTLESGGLCWVDSPHESTAEAFDSALRKLRLRN